jgi:hypothetical protein
MYLVEVCHCPSFGIAVVAVVFQPTISAATALVSTHSAAGDVLLTFIAFAGTGAVLGYVWHVAHSNPCVLEHRKHSQKERTSGVLASVRKLLRCLESEEHWAAAHESDVPSGAGAESLLPAAAEETAKSFKRKKRWKRMHLVVFQDLRVPKYVVLDTTASVGFGVIGGVVANTLIVCRIQLILMLMLYLVLCVAVIAVRPGLSLATQFFLMTTNAVGLVCTATLVASNVTQSVSMEQAAAILTVVLSGLATLKSLADVSTVLAVFPRMLKRLAHCVLSTGSGAILRPKDRLHHIDGGEDEDSLKRPNIATAALQGIDDGSSDDTDEWIASGDEDATDDPFADNEPSECATVEPPRTRTSATPEPLLVVDDTYYTAVGASVLLNSQEEGDMDLLARMLPVDWLSAVELRTQRATSSEDSSILDI